MAPLRWSCVVLTALGLAACGSEPGGDDGDGGGAGGDAPLADASSPDASVCTGTPNKVIYMSRGGGEYFTGVADDSTTNVSALLDRDVMIEPPALTDVQWRALLDCVRGLYAPFAVELTDSDPGVSAHREVVFVGNWAAVRLGTNWAGATYPWGCGLTIEDADGAPNGVVMMNPALAGDDVSLLCNWTAAVAAYSFGLDMANYCPDVTSNGSNCGEKSFVDMEVTCGDGIDRPCRRCAGDPQNSYQYLLGLIGPCN